MRLSECVWSAIILVLAALEASVRAKRQVFLRVLRLFDVLSFLLIPQFRSEFGYHMGFVWAFVASLILPKSSKSPLQWKHSSSLASTFGLAPREDRRLKRKYASLIRIWKNTRWHREPFLTAWVALVGHSLDRVIKH